MAFMVLPFRFSLVILILSVCLCGSARLLHAQHFEVYENLQQLQARINRAGDTVLVVNFWATWCKSCVEELPCFEELRKRYHTQQMQVLLVSLDFKGQIEKKFIPFLEKHQIKSEVALMTDQSFDDWIPMIDEEWDGAIPATLVLKGKKRRFIMGKFEDIEDLENFVRPFVTDSTLLIGKKLNCEDLAGRKR